MARAGGVVNPPRHLATSPPDATAFQKRLPHDPAGGGVRPRAQTDGDADTPGRGRARDGAVYVSSSPGSSEDVLQLYWMASPLPFWMPAVAPLPLS